MGHYMYGIWIVDRVLEVFTQNPFVVYVAALCALLVVLHLADKRARRKRIAAFAPPPPPPPPPFDMFDGRDEPEPVVNPFALDSWNMTEQVKLWKIAPGLAYKLATMASATDEYGDFAAQHDAPILKCGPLYREGPQAQHHADLTNTWAAASVKRREEAAVIASRATHGITVADAKPDADAGRVEIIARDTGDDRHLLADGSLAERPVSFNPFLCAPYGRNGGGAWAEGWIDSGRIIPRDGVLTPVTVS